jgi:hypothetical protein
MKKNIFSVGLFFALGLLMGTQALGQTPASPVTPVQFLNVPSSPQLQETVVQLFSGEDTRLLRVEKAEDSNAVIVRIFSKRFHKFETTHVSLAAAHGGPVVVRNYVPAAFDSRVTAPKKVFCPDPETEFVAFAPNDNDLEQSITIEVAKAAQAKGLKTVSLLRTQATSANYLNYLSCPKLKGNFYDGDANPTEIVTVDGSLTYDDFRQYLPGAFRYKVTNIWLACEAYNNPLLPTMVNTVHVQKYAAGINDLEIGPSDKTGACAMEEALAGRPMTAAFHNCYDKLDVRSDEWGFGGDGSDQFGD